MGRRLWCENLESLLIAIIFVLMLRFFFLEPFKIPSTSMEPTLIGDPACGDQILVNKFVYHFRTPKRWEVIVFRYPLNCKRNFIKRLVGLPGEKLTIKNGNIYIDGSLARKPHEAQQALLSPVFSGPIKDKWRLKGNWKQAGKSLTLQTKEKAWCTYDREITNEYLPRSDRHFLKRVRPVVPAGGEHTVAEVRLAFKLRFDARGIALAKLYHDSHCFILSIGKKSRLEHYEDESKLVQTVSFQYDWHPKKLYAIEFENIDELVTAKVDGATVATIDWARPLDKAPDNSYDSGVSLGGKNGLFEFSEISLWRDIYYLARGGVYQKHCWEIPPHHYFVLGDNSPQSNDSRDWKIFCLILKDGTSLEGDQQQPPRIDGDSYCFTDTKGIEHKIAREQKADSTHNIKSPFVPADCLLGRAFSVFWPPPRVKIIY